MPPLLQVWAPAAEHDDITAGLVALTDKIASDARVAMDLLPVGDGVLLCRKIK
jgi:predicted O-methyltransferase YrrM